MKSRWSIAIPVLLSTLLVSSSFSFIHASPEENKSHKVAGPGDYYFVQLQEEPVAVHQTKVTKDNGIQKLKTPEAQTYRDQLKQSRNKYKNWLKGKVKNAKISAEYSTLLHGIAVKADEVNANILSQGPGVKKVVRSKKYLPVMNRSHTIINDLPAWNLGYRGNGIKVGVIDSGIDNNHPFLKDDSLKIPDGFPKVNREEDIQYTSNKVIVAKVYSPDTSATPKAIDSHGTHVAGTIAGVEGYSDPSGTVKSKLSGVAPKAYLGNYNVFPCEDCSAESIHIAKAVEDAVNDGMEVVNMSLGGEATPGFDLLVEVVNAASDAGVSMVIAAGNEGPGAMTIGSPGIAEKAITVGAVTNNHLIGSTIKVKIDGTEKDVLVGVGEPGGKITSKVEAPLAIVSEDSGLGCNPLSGDVKGKVAVVKRGGCTFTDKAKNAQDKGAVGVIIVNNAAGDPASMSVEDMIKIPTLMVSDKDGAWILKGQQVTTVIEPKTPSEVNTDNDSYIANFSSRGPTVNYTLKPDLAAVGVNVYSSVVGGGLQMFNGTSMATPHVAGAVALLKQAHPNWTPQNLKSALVGTARDAKDTKKPVDVGSGIMNVGAALNPVAMLEPASLSFGKVKSKTGEVKIKVSLKNTTNQTQVYMIQSDQKKAVKISKPLVTLRKGQTTTFEVKAIGKDKNSNTDVQGYITVKTLLGKQLRLPYYYFVE
ncbi:S8 family serine peptidase [Thermoflavimicrobium daqui]|uniref:Peptidase S8 n=1 Tax=Thermoflavimicrobium daqui TaxID=2137476 RepID=A0A364K5V4_9BACL|nr:S8 family serine peptidase [Thermoflavimicrobium daqui]RAL25570.1 hypothetical protein DL897_05680 [Thermoflavimicrobium daqui]